MSKGRREEPSLEPAMRVGVPRVGRGAQLIPLSIPEPGECCARGIAALGWAFGFQTR